MDSSSLREKAENELSAAGLGPAKLARERRDEEHSRNAEVVFSIGTLRLRFVRDRGQEFLDLASSAEPERFFLFDDVELAMGWRTIDAVVTKQNPADLRNVLARIKERQDELDHAFSTTHWTHTAGRLESAAKLRGDAFLRRLQQLAKPS
ncbi:MAG TPA: hypothetical protein VJU18_09595 [Vicinamibacteria bacterium]|nr:hypothetical protein [Vicinamibacteria bacterium]